MWTLKLSVPIRGAQHAGIGIQELHGARWPFVCMHGSARMTACPMPPPHSGPSSHRPSGVRALSPPGASGAPDS
jgi:hypothetical protein